MRIGFQASESRRRSPVAPRSSRWRGAPTSFARTGGSTWLGSGPGRTFGLGGLLAVAGGVVGMAVTAPTGRKLGTLGAAMAAAGRPPTPDELATMQSLQRRLATAAALVAVLVVLATVAMAVARYVP